MKSKHHQAEARQDLQTVCDASAKWRCSHQKRSLAGRVRAHVFLCMLADYVEWHMRQALAPILFDDEDQEEANRRRPSVVAPAQRSASANRKARRKRNDNDEPVHSFQTLLTDLATICKDSIKPNLPDDAPLFDKVTVPTSLQHPALDLRDDLAVRRTRRHSLAK